MVKKEGKWNWKLGGMNFLAVLDGCFLNGVVE